MYKNVTITLKNLIHFIYGCMLSFFHFLWCFECFSFIFLVTRMWDMVACMLKNFFLLLIFFINPTSFTITHVGYNHMYGGHNHIFQIFFTFDHVYVDSDCLLSFLCQFFVISATC